MTAPGASVLVPAGPQADRIGALWNGFLAVAVVVAVLVIAVTAIGAHRAAARRRREGEDHPLTRSPAQERRLHAAIVAATGATVITLVVLVIASMRTGHALAALGDRDDVSITITGHQWWWEVVYDADDPPRRFTTANELHVPVGRTVHLRLRSADVIHSFWAPSLHGKKDLIPGRDNHLWLRADAAGTFVARCAEFCGVQHATMALPVIAEPAEAFDAWRARQLEPARSPTTAEEMRGREVFVTGTCGACHAVSGTPAGGALGPDLTHVASRGSLGAGALPNTPDARRAWIVDPQRHKPGVRMPPHALAAEDLDAVLAYLESLK